LISTYPNYLNGKTSEQIELKDVVKSGFISIKNLFSKLTELRKGIINSGVYDGFFKVLKDYLQPILKVEILSISLFSYISSQEKRLSIFLGFSYAVIYLLSSFASRKAFKIMDKFKDLVSALNKMYLITTLIIFSIALTINSRYSLIIILFFIAYYIIRSVRRPIMLDYIADIMEEKERATMLSIESQFRTIFIIFTAPAVGFIADLWGLKAMFFIVFLTMILSMFLIKISSFDEESSN